MKRLSVAVLALTGFAGPALAADMPARPVYKAPAAPAYSWTGCYLGAGGGYAMSNSRESVPGPLPFTSPETDFGGRGWFGTVQGGCDYQFDRSWVVGAFADYDFGTIKGTTTHDFGGAYFGEEKQNWSWAIGARLGWLPFDNLMTYVSGGYTQAHYDRTDYSFLNAFPAEFYIADRTFGGWFIGTGYEYNLGWFPGLTWKTEYRFADYGRKTSDLLVTGVNAPTVIAVDQHKYAQSIRSELVYRFNWWR